MSLLTLGADAELFLHSADPPDAGRGALLRAQLVRGALRVDGRPKSGLPPQDLRLNLGQLRLRVFGAEVWMERSASAETVCLLSGAVEIQSSAGPERLDAPGDCLLFGAHGRRLHVRPDGEETLARKLVRTAFAEDYVTRIAAEQAPAAAPAQAAPPGTEAAPVPAPAAIPPPPAPSAPRGAAPGGAVGLPPAPAAGAAGPGRREPASGWTVVVASFPEQPAAEAEAARLRALGLQPTVRSRTDQGITKYRVTLGAFAAKEEARAYGVQVQGRHALASFWLTEF
jgi:hypothetical protein